MMHYAFDIETEQGDEATIRALHDPFVKPDAPDEFFDPSQVKVGHLKDQAKIDAKIDDARQAHAQALASYAADCDAAEKEYWRAILERAALSPATGRIVVVGVHAHRARPI